MAQTFTLITTYLLVFAPALALLIVGLSNLADGR
jgi:hypothetical protein